MAQESGKLPGKTEYSGRRRTVTRKSGFKSDEGSTGGEIHRKAVPITELDSNSPLVLEFDIPQKNGQLAGFGAWFTSNQPINVSIQSDLEIRVTLDQNSMPDWGKFGSIWTAVSDETVNIKVTLTSSDLTRIAIYNPQCGVINHPHLDQAMEVKPVLLKNMYQFAPEAIFVSTPGEVRLNHPAGNETVEVVNKSCNRCARFLPINLNDERAHLSFSNHCVAPHRRPCSHSGFGKLRDIETGQFTQLDYGYQLECRFCKKFEVNAALNPKRTPGQMKEDGARRRFIELLLTDLFGGSSQMLFRHKNKGLELADYIWRKFSAKCFNCDEPIAGPREMHLDHTRPLALLWPLDETATCLCGSCNSQKRDRSPSEFYSSDKLVELSSITGIRISDLQTPGPNTEAIDLLCSRQDWFFDEFLTKPELLKEREGKVAADLLVKALQKVINQSPSEQCNLQEEYNRRRA